jgi:hypothetical protein
MGCDIHTFALARGKLLSDDREFLGDRDFDTFALLGYPLSDRKQAIAPLRGRHPVLASLERFDARYWWINILQSCSWITLTELQGAAEKEASEYFRSEVSALTVAGADMLVYGFSQ